MTFDSTAETLKHIRRVGYHLGTVIRALLDCIETHDDSKLELPEKPVFDEYTPKLSATTYGSAEYRAALDGMKTALDHHNASNSHHPEHYVDGINDFDLIDLIEMLCDWKAATERHNDGDILRSITINEARFDIAPQLVSILRNTAMRLGWAPGEVTCSKPKSRS